MIQWMSAAAFLYTEVGVTTLMCIGIISNAQWRKVFGSRLVHTIQHQGNFYFSAFVLILALLFADSVNSTWKYTITDSSETDLHNNPMSEVHVQMKLFRSQRNMYISGFALLLLLIIRRLAQLISKQATLEASFQAISKQAKGASDQCQKLMKENSLLIKDGNCAGIAEEKSVHCDDCVEDKSKDKVEELKQLQKKIRKMEELVRESERKQESAEEELQATKQQTKDLQDEYSVLSDECTTMSKNIRLLGGGE